MIAYANYCTDARIKNYVDALLRRDYKVDVFALGNDDQVAQVGLDLILVMEKYWGSNAFGYAVSQLWFSLLVTFMVSWRFLRRRYSIIHVHNIPNFLVFTAVVPKLFGAKIILDVHDTMPEAYATKFNLPLDHPLIGLFRFEERLSASFVHHVITTNDLHKEALVGHGIPWNKITIIMNVGNKTVFSPKHNDNPRNGLTLAYHGTIAERLGLNLILEAIQQVRLSCPDLRFILIGDGDYMPAIRRLILKYHIEDVVKTTGWVPVERLPNYLERVDVGVVGNRRYTEIRQNWMLPVKMLEYAAMEIPTIAPRLRVIQHYFDNNNAILYEPDSTEDLVRCIRYVYERPENLENLKQGLREFNARFNWVDMERRYLNLVSNLISGR